MLLSNLLQSSKIEYTLYGGIAPRLEVGEIFLDSRRVVSRGLYIAIDGLHQDSHLWM